jgi:hypothetical protein
LIISDRNLAKGGNEDAHNNHSGNQYIFLSFLQLSGYG